LNVYNAATRSTQGITSDEMANSFTHELGHAAALHHKDDQPNLMNTNGNNSNDLTPEQLEQMDKSIPEKAPSTTPQKK
jgi:hypothetical protein